MLPMKHSGVRALQLKTSEGEGSFMPKNSAPGQIRVTRKFTSQRSIADMLKCLLRAHYPF